MATPGYDKEDMNRRMNGAVATLKQEFAGLRTGRANPSLLDPVTVEAYGNTMPINQVGTVSAPEPRLITVQVWDKGLAKAVDKAVRDAGLGLNPQLDGQLLRIPLPELNEERRKELVKLAHKYTTRSARTNSINWARICRSSRMRISVTSIRPCTPKNRRSCRFDVV